jgi:hypothetical protein
MLLTTSTKYSNNTLHYRSNIHLNKYNKIGKRYYSTSNNSTSNKGKNLSIEELKSLHHIYIKDLYKDRNAIVKPFQDKVLATCENINNKSEFIKK